MTQSFLSEAFLELVTPDLYLVIAGVYGVCFALKKAKFFDDRFIPLASIVLGIGFEIGAFLSLGGEISNFVLRGIVAGLSAVYAANIIKQMGDEKI